MREWCNCGSGIRTFSRRAHQAWREQHFHAVDEPTEPQADGSHAHIEHAGRRYFESESAYSHDIPIVQARTGFQP